LHGSRYNDGDPDHIVKPVPAGSTARPKLLGAGVHSFYEDTMVDNNIVDLGPNVQSLVKKVSNVDAKKITTGREAAVALMGLMTRTAATIKPKQILDYFTDTLGSPKPSNDAAVAKLYGHFGGKTAKVMADGAQTLALLWQAAWVAGGGEVDDDGEIDKARLKKLYDNPNKLKSYTLRQIKPHLSA